MSSIFYEDFLHRVNKRRNKEAEEHKERKKAMKEIDIKEKKLWLLCNVDLNPYKINGVEEKQEKNSNKKLVEKKLGYFEQIYIKLTM